MSFDSVESERSATRIRCIREDAEERYNELPSVPFEDPRKLAAAGIVLPAEIALSLGGLDAYGITTYEQGQ